MSGTACTLPAATCSCMHILRSLSVSCAPHGYTSLAAVNRQHWGHADALQGFTNGCKDVSMHAGVLRAMREHPLVQSRPRPARSQDSGSKAIQGNVGQASLKQYFW